MLVYQRVCHRKSQANMNDFVRNPHVVDTLQYLLVLQHVFGKKHGIDDI